MSDKRLFSFDLEVLPYSLDQWTTFLGRLPHLLRADPKDIHLSSEEDLYGEKAEGLIIGYSKEVDGTEGIGDLERRIADLKGILGPKIFALEKKRSALESIKGLPGEVDLASIVRKLEEEIDKEETEYRALLHRRDKIDSKIESIGREDEARVLDYITRRG